MLKRGCAIDADSEVLDPRDLRDRERRVQPGEHALDAGRDGGGVLVRLDDDLHLGERELVVRHEHFRPGGELQARRA